MSYPIYREFLALRTFHTGQREWTYTTEANLPINKPLVSSTGAWVVDYLNNDLETVRVRECPADTTFVVPCAKIIGTITLTLDGGIDWDGQYFSYFYGNPL